MAKQGTSVDKSKGIWVSIGYKELEPFLRASRSGIEVQEKLLTSLRNAGIEAVQASTRQYAKRQHRYIRIRLANALVDTGNIDRFFVLDGTDLELWDENVISPARKVAEKFLQDEALPDPSELSDFARSQLADVNASEGSRDTFLPAQMRDMSEDSDVGEGVGGSCEESRPPKSLEQGPKAL